MAKILTTKGWVVGTIIEDRYFLIKSVMYPINDDGRVVVGKERFIVYNIDYKQEA